MMEPVKNQGWRNPLEDDDRGITDSILLHQMLLLDQEDQRKLIQAVVSIAGVGGIGCPALEVLARNAVSYFKIADRDHYELPNARQLFMTQQTVGRLKAEVAKERVLAINPKARIEIWNDGVNPATYGDFCAGSDVICNQTDQLDCFIVLNYAGQRFRKPVVNAGRASWPERHLLTVKVMDYRSPDQDFNLAKIDFERKWGVEGALITGLMEYIKKEEDCPELRMKINEQNQLHRKKRLLEAIMNGHSAVISDKNREYLQSIAESHPSRFHKMAISPEEALMMGCLAGAAIKDIILGRKVSPMAINIYNGAAIAPFYKENI